MASEFTIDIQLTELGFHQLPVFDEELPVKEESQNSSSSSLVSPPTPPKLSPAPSKLPPKSSSESPATPTELLPGPPKLSPAHPKLSPAPSNSLLQSLPALTQVIPLSNKPSPAVNSPVDQRLLCLVQQNVHSLPKTLPVAIMVTNTPSSLSTHVVAANIQPQRPQPLAGINGGSPPKKKAATSKTKSTDEIEDTLKDVVFTEETLTLGEKKNADGKRVSNEKKAIVVRYTAKQTSAENKTTAKEVVPQKDGATSQSDGNVHKSQVNDTQDESDDSEVSEEEEEEEEDTYDVDDSEFFAPGAVDLHLWHLNCSCAQCILLH